MRIGIASDHRGYDLKKSILKYLSKKNYDVTDYGTDSKKISVDYTKYAFMVGEAVSKDEVDYGVVICGTGIGISIACNKVKGIRCAKVDNIKDAKLAREHNNSNVLALRGDLSKYKAKDIIDVFFGTTFSNEDRHVNRINQIKTYEKSRKYER